MGDCPPFLNACMLRTKSLILGVNDVPREWVFENYLQLDEKLTGQDVRIRSPFSTDNNPSLYIFYSEPCKHYKFKDFSTGKSGDGVTLVMSLMRISSRSEAAQIVVSDYNKFILTNKEDFSLRKF